MAWGAVGGLKGLEDSPKTAKAKPSNRLLRHATQARKRFPKTLTFPVATALVEVVTVVEEVTVELVRVVEVLAAFLEPHRLLNQCLGSYLYLQHAKSGRDSTQTLRCPSRVAVGGVSSRT